MIKRKFIILFLLMNLSIPAFGIDAFLKFDFTEKNDITSELMIRDVSKGPISFFMILPFKIENKNIHNSEFIFQIFDFDTEETVVYIYNDSNGSDIRINLNLKYTVDFKNQDVVFQTIQSNLLDKKFILHLLSIDKIIHSYDVMVVLPNYIKNEEQINYLPRNRTLLNKNELKYTNINVFKDRVWIKFPVQKNENAQTLLFILLILLITALSNIINLFKFQRRKNGLIGIFSILILIVYIISLLIYFSFWKQSVDELTSTIFLISHTAESLMTISSFIYIFLKKKYVVKISLKVTVNGEVKRLIIVQLLEVNDDGTKEIARVDELSDEGTYIFCIWNLKKEIRNIKIKAEYDYNYSVVSREYICEKGKLYNIDDIEIIV